jgi:hypothetical protein
MRLILSILLLFPLLAFSGSSDVTVSPKRYLNETFDQAVKRIKNSVPPDRIKSLIKRDTPIGKKVPIKQIDFSLVPVVATYDEMIHLFKVIRDTRFLRMEDKPEFERRISWLYPDDGCFARAALSIIKLDREHLLKPAKIFAFGDLLLETPYSSGGYVSWWYHVSTAVSYMGAIYILDPALNPEGPLVVDDWYSKMSSEAGLFGVVCNSSTYAPFDHCYQDSDISEERILRDGSKYLDLEWERIGLLGFEPMSLLGNNPPWIIDVIE